jgi:hypothetical protein
MRGSRALAKIVITVFISFLLLEQGARIYLFGLDSFNFHKMNSFHPMGVSGLIQASPYAEMIYELKPNLDTYFKMARFGTNAHGLRDREYAVKKPDDTFRVAVVGDSCVMAAGVEIEEAFHSVLEERCNAESQGLSYEFINFGVGGYDPHQYLAVVERKVLEWDPDLVLFCLTGTVENFYSKRFRERTYTVKEKTYPFFESFLLKLAQTNKIYVAFEERKKRARKTNDTGDRPRIREEVRKTESIFSDLSRISKEKHVPVCVAILVHYYWHDGMVKYIEERAYTYGLYSVDTMEPFKARGKENFDLYPIDAHPNAEAHGIFADVFYDYLGEKNLLTRGG